MPSLWPGAGAAQAMTLRPLAPWGAGGAPHGTSRPTPCPRPVTLPPGWRGRRGRQPALCPATRHDVIHSYIYPLARV